MTQAIFRAFGCYHFLATVYIGVSVELYPEISISSLLVRSFHSTIRVENNISQRSVHSISLGFLECSGSVRVKIQCVCSGETEEDISLVEKTWFRTCVNSSIFPMYKKWGMIHHCMTQPGYLGSRLRGRLLVCTGREPGTASPP